jgi:hypothetical protein
MFRSLSFYVNNWSAFFVKGIKAAIIANHHASLTILIALKFNVNDEKRKKQVSVVS